MEIDPILKIVKAKVMHHRLIPRRNLFIYNMFYFVVPLARILDKSGTSFLGFNRPALFSIYAKDHGDKSGVVPLNKWVQSLLDIINIPEIDKDNLQLITLPRVFGYVFNPVSFWICTDSQKQLRAVICEVNNTFNERHVYLCFHDNHAPILPDDEIFAQKVFHVSPFLKREGTYKFKFAFMDDKFSAIIDYANARGEKTLLTSVMGKIVSITSARLLHAFIAYPFITLKVIILIHWQALKTIMRGIRYIPKPVAFASKVSMPLQQPHQPEKSE